MAARASRLALRSSTVRRTRSRQSTRFRACGALLPRPARAPQDTDARSLRARPGWVCAGTPTFTRRTRRQGATTNELQHKVLEYCIHRHAIRAEDDVKGLDGAWWVPLRKLVGDIGQEATEEALEAFEATLIKDRKERLEQVLAGNSSEDDREDDDI